LRQGWVSLHRKLLESNVFQDEKLLKIWIYCLLKATHKEHEQLVGKQLVNLSVGEFVFGRKKASSDLKISESTVWRNMKLLEKMGNISINSNNKFSVVKVENYQQYQSDKEDFEQQVNNKRTTNEQQVNTNNNINNINNINKDIRTTQFDSIIREWNSLDKNISEIQSINSGTKRYTMLQARINEYGEDKVIDAIKNVNKSSFLKGYKKDWKITFDWFVKPNNFIKVLENNYSDETNISNFGSSKPISDIEKENQRIVDEMFGGGTLT